MRWLNTSCILALKVCGQLTDFVCCPWQHRKFSMECKNATFEKHSFSSCVEKQRTATAVKMEECALFVGDHGVS